MRLRQLVLACGLASLLVSPLVNALGLGEVRLNSTLNQPLQAEISLLDTRDLTAEQIIVSLASPADFERNGVDRLYFYTEFKFEVVLDGPAGPVVKVTSRTPVREPYLNFLIEARWTAGRLLREYTLLMDLPTYDDNKSVSPVVTPRQVEAPKESQSVQGRVSRQSQTQAQNQTEESTETQSETTQERNTSERSVSRVAQDGEYTIKPNDTLWEIALDVRPDTSVSVHQAMVALYEANPEAFINGNISRLKEGRVLRVPDASQMTSVTKSDAATQFSQLESGMGAQLSASRRTTTEATESSEVAGRVTLAASNTARSSTAGQGSGADNGSGRALESELASTMEELDRVKSENSELNSRVQDLEAQIQTMEKMVEVSNEKMRALQVSAEKTNQESKAVENVKSELKSDVKKSVESSVSSVAPKPVEPKVEVKDEAKPATTKPEKAAQETVKPKVIPKPVAPPAPTLVDQLIANAPWIGIGVVLLGGLIGFFFYQRRKQAQMESEQQDDYSYSNDSDISFDTSMDDHEEFDESQLETQQQDSFESLESEDDDVNPADKADIFIAYGQLDKAEHLLLKGLDTNPNSADIRLKLLEVYSQQGDAAKFDKHYAALIPIAAPALLSRASELRSHISGAGDFDMPDLAPDLSDEPAVKAQQAASLDDLELDLGDDLFVESSQSVADQDDDFSIELDLTDDVDVQDTVMRGQVQADDDFSIELDLNDDVDVQDTVMRGQDDDSDLLLDLDFDSPAENNLKHEVELESQADDIGDINLALDDMDDDLPDDIDITPLELEKEPSLAPVKSASQELELADDDFNLEMTDGDLDLAALDSEMSSLDTDFNLDDESDELDIDFNLDDESLTLDDSELSEVASADLSLDEMDLGDDLGDSDLESDLGLSLDDDQDSEEEMEILEEEPEAVSEDTLFEQALSDIDDQDVALTEFDTEQEQDLDSDELDFLGEADEAATKLDLARAYIDMGDMTGARDILSEVVNEGTGEQKAEAKDLLSRIDA